MSSLSTDRSAITAPWRIGVDVGGTFTDLVLVDANGALRVGKVPSTPARSHGGRPRRHRSGGRRTVAVERRACSAAAAHFVHGSTVATNIVLERRGSPVGMLVTRGFRDSLEIRRGIRKNAWDHRTPFPPPLAPRYLRLPVGGRIDRRGEELEPLCTDDIRAAVRIFREENVSSIAICLFNSFLDDRHEREAAALLEQEYAEAWVTLSSAVTPIMGEYERSSTAVLNAYVAPSIVSYVAPARRGSGGARTAGALLRRPEQRRRDDGRGRSVAGRLRSFCRAPRRASARSGSTAARSPTRTSSRWRSAARAAT